MAKLSRFFIALLAVALTSMVASPVHAIAAKAKRIDFHTTFTVSVAGGVMTVGQAVTTEIVQYADGTREMIETTESDPTSSEASSLATCVSDRQGTEPGYTAFTPIHRVADPGFGHAHYVFSLSKLENARELTNPANGNKYKTQQWEVCAKGNGQTDIADWQLYQLGGAAADTDSSQPRLIGWKYKTGATPPSYTLKYGFAMGTSACVGPEGEAQACSDTSISGEVSQEASGRLRGGSEGPGSANNAYADNNVAGWWDGEEVGGDEPFHSHGTVIHGLWEYPMSNQQTALDWQFDIFGYALCKPFLIWGCDVPPADTNAIRTPI